MKPAYLKKVDTGECFAYSPWLEARNDMVPWTGPLPVTVAPQASAPKQAAIALPEAENVPPEAAQSVEPVEAEAEPEAKPQWQCEVCGFVAKTSSGLRLHMIKHKN